MNHDCATINDEFRTRRACHKGDERDVCNMEVIPTRSICSAQSQASKSRIQERHYFYEVQEWLNWFKNRDGLALG